MPGLKFLVILAVIFFVGFKLWPTVQQKYYLRDFKSMNYEMEGRSYKLLVADDEQKREQGLMHITDLKGYDGMIFLFPDRGFRTFWNKNTLMNLKIYWLDEDNVVGVSDLPSIRQTADVVTASSPSEVNKVVELPNN